MGYYNDKTILYLDGEYLKATEAKTDFFGQSLHYGYAVFEGIRAYKTANGDTKIFKAVEHFNRMKISADAVGIPYPYSNSQLIDASYELLAKNDLQDSYIRPLVFCDPLMSLQKATQSHIMIAVWEWGNYFSNKQLRVMTSSYERPNPKGFKVHAKVSGHYVNSILACQEAKDNGYDEALLLDIHGFVAEGPGANVFFEKDGRLYTPPLGNILPGITRATVIEICEQLNIPVEEKLFSPEELKKADAAFFCGTAAEIAGWQSLDGSTFKKPWEDSLGKIIQQAYKAKVLESDLKLELVV